MRYNMLMPYRLMFRKQAVKALRRMPPAQSQRILAAIDSLADEPPDRRDMDVAPLAGQPGFRLRVGGIRVIYLRDDTVRQIEVLRIAPRGDAYRP